MKYVFVFTFLSGLLLYSTIDVYKDKPNTKEAEPTPIRVASPEALEELKLGHRILLHRLSPAEIAKHRIKSIQEDTFSILRFNKQGYLIYEKYSVWTGGSTFGYEFDTQGNPTSISSIDTNGKELEKAYYLYGAKNKLRKVGIYQLTYYPDGKLKSVADDSQIEKYKYDSRDNLIHIRFDFLPGVIGCGNRTYEWKGEYNALNQLIREEVREFPTSRITHYTYNELGQIKEAIHFSDYSKQKTGVSIYENGLLIRTTSLAESGQTERVVNYMYEFF